MKTIKINFSGMSGVFDPYDNFIINILKKHFAVEISNNPDFLVYSDMSKDFLNYKCVRIYYTPENITPDFNLCDYAIGFNYISFMDRYIRFPIYLVDSFKAYSLDSYGEDLNLAQHKHEVEATDRKTDFCAFVYSNAEAASCREKIFTELSKYKKVNSGGRYKNNIGEPVDNKLEFQKKHKFVIAFENSSTPGYTTEKIVHAFAARTIPIYWGNPDITKEFNSHSFINCHDYGLTHVGETEAIGAIIDRIKEIDQNDEEYNRMISAPAFIYENYVNEKRREFEEYLIHIFSQEKKIAYRRNLLYWGERYERRQRIGNSFYWQCRKLIPIRDGVRKLIKHI